MEEGGQYTQDLLDVHRWKTLMKRQGIFSLSHYDPVDPLVFREWVADENAIWNLWQASVGM